MCFANFLFFSSRRRHTRLVSDWSSDVCSSDLKAIPRAQLCRNPASNAGDVMRLMAIKSKSCNADGHRKLLIRRLRRSEERRVGKDCSTRGKTRELKRKIRSKEASKQHETNTKR